MQFIHITRIAKTEYGQVLDVWEASVRATHHFLKEEDFEFYRSQIPAYLEAVDLFAIRDAEKQLWGFMGVSEEEIEMLFVHPDVMGQGAGTTLIEYAVRTLRKSKVCVNEQNGQAFRFYRRHGFEVVRRSECDHSGKPYPILHLALK